MRLICVSRFRGEGPDGFLHDYKAGQEINVTDSRGEYLLRKSPAAFDDPARIAAEKVAKVKAEAPDEPDVSAMSTETATGIVAPDRRARGGGVRARGKSQ